MNPDEWVLARCIGVVLFVTLAYIIGFQRGYTQGKEEGTNR